MLAWLFPVYPRKDKLLKIPVSMSLLLRTTFIKFQKGWKSSWHSFTAQCSKLDWIIEKNWSLEEEGTCLRFFRWQQWVSNKLYLRFHTNFFSNYKVVLVLNGYWDPSYCKVHTSFQSEMFSFYFQLTIFYFFLTDHWTSTSKSLKKKSENKQKKSMKKFEPSKHTRERK